MTNHLRLDATVEGPRGWVACGWILMLVSHVFAPVFFNSPFFFLPRHADGMREGFGGGLPCHSAFLSRPSATLVVRGGFLPGGLAYRFLQLLFFAFFPAS